MNVINIMDDNFSDLLKYKAIGSIDQITEGALVKIKQIKGAKYFFIWDGYRVIWDSSKGGAP